MMLWLGWRYRPRQRDPVVEAYAALKRKLAKAGVVATPHEGPVDFLDRAAQAQPALTPRLHELRDLYIALRYQPHPTAEQSGRLRHLVNQLSVKSA